jgi:hypothetical protein
MDVFSLRQRLVGDYSAFARSFNDILATDIKEGVEAEYAGGRYWPDPLVQINPRYAAGRLRKPPHLVLELHPESQEGLLLRSRFGLQAQVDVGHAEQGEG